MSTNLQEAGDKDASRVSTSASAIHMPLYFLHLYEGSVLTEDVEGTEFLDLDAAIREAELGAQDSIAAMLGGGEPVEGQRVEIVDESGRAAATVHFVDVLQAIENNLVNEQKQRR